jgi:hypothetical protein
MENNNLINGPFSIAMLNYQRVTPVVMMDKIGLLLK